MAPFSVSPLEDKDFDTNLEYRFSKDGDFTSPGYMACWPVADGDDVAARGRCLSTRNMDFMRWRNPRWTDRRMELI
jgi:hypothetical protein